jgi:sporulation protein YlmC with PRC-barrel domain
MQGTTRLARLSETDYTIENPEQDVRGRSVVDRQGKEAGTIDDLFFDVEERRVRFLRVSSGGFLGLAETTFLVPVDAVVRVESDRVQIDETGERIREAPPLEAEVVEDDERIEDVYRYWGYVPFWAGPGYVAPGYPGERRE